MTDETTSNNNDRQKNRDELLDAIVHQAAKSLALFSLMYTVTKALADGKYKEAPDAEFIDKDATIKVVVTSMKRFGDELSEILIAAAVLNGHHPRYAIELMQTYAEELNSSVDIPDDPNEQREIIRAAAARMDKDTATT